MAKNSFLAKVTLNVFCVYLFNFLCLEKLKFTLNMCFIVLIHPAMLCGHFLFLEQEYSGIEKHCKEINGNFLFQIFFVFEETRNSCNPYQLRNDIDFLVFHKHLLGFL